MTARPQIALSHRPIGEADFKSVGNWQRDTSTCCSQHEPLRRRERLLKLVAEEEGFYFPQYEGGTRWHTLVRYIRSIANKQFTFYPRKRGLPSPSNSASFCSTRITVWGVHSALTNQDCLPVPAGTWEPCEELS